MTDRQKQVLLYLYERRYRSIHYGSFIDIIFDKGAFNPKRIYHPLKVNRMACLYLGRMAAKGWIYAKYNEKDEYEGHCITASGVKALETTPSKVFSTERGG